jgi:hypothetical protein
LGGKRLENGPKRPETARKRRSGGEIWGVGRYLGIKYLKIPDLPHLTAHYPTLEKIRNPAAC